MYIVLLAHLRLVTGCWVSALVALALARPDFEPLASQLVYPYIVQRKQGSHLRLSLNTNFQDVPIQERIVVAQETPLSLLGHMWGFLRRPKQNKKYQRE